MSEETKEEQNPTVPPEQNLPENEITVEDAGVLKKKVTVKVPEKRIQAKLDEMFGELGRTAQVPGFRIGRAPRRLIEKRFGREVSQDVRNALIGEAITPAMEKSKLKPLGDPDLDLDKIVLPDKGEMTFSFEVEVAPEFELPAIKGIKVQKRKVVIDQARVEQQLEQWRQSQARFEDAAAPAAEGDIVKAEARIRGEGLDEVHHKELTLRVAPGQVDGLPLVDLGKELAGKKAGDTAEVKVKAPEAHPNETWRGKELTVALTVSQVQRRVLPEVNEELAKSQGFASLAELQQYVSRNLEARTAVEVKKAMRDQVEQFLLDNTKCDIPEGVAARHAAGVLRRRYVDLLYMGIPRERIDENLTQLQAEAAQQSQRDLKLSFILQRVAENDQIAVSDDEVNSRIAEMARQYNRRPEKLRQELQEEGTLGQVEISLREEKALDKILEQAEITEVAEDAPKAEEPKKKKAHKEEAAEEAPEKAHKKEAKEHKEHKEKKEAKEEKPKAKAHKEDKEHEDKGEHKKAAKKSDSKDKHGKK